MWMGCECVFEAINELGGHVLDHVLSDTVPRCMWHMCEVGKQI